MPNPEFNTFLFAFLGKDGNGRQVTVLSTVLRLGLDPWREASRLSDLPSDAAAIIVAEMITKVGDVALDVADAQKTACRVVNLLPLCQREPVRLKVAADAGEHSLVCSMPSTVPDRRTNR